MKKLLSLVFVLIVATVAANAQFPGGGMQPFGQSNGTLLESTPQGIFVLRSGVLAKFDAKTLQLYGSKELFGALPTAPQPTDQQAVIAFRDENAKRNAPAIMIPTDDALIIVIGSTFFRVNQDTLDFTQADLSAPNAAMPVGHGRFAPPPVYKLSGNTLYLLQDNELINVSIQDGKVISRATLPDSMISNPRGNRGGPGAGLGRHGGPGGAPGGGGAPNGAPGGAPGGGPNGGANGAPAQ